MEKYTENFVITAKSTPAGDRNDLTLDEVCHNSGFALASFEENGFKTVLMHVNIAQLAEWISSDSKLLMAARLAVMFNGIKDTMTGSTQKDQSVSIEKLFGLEG